MTTEANDYDPRVSDTYRALATEKTPPELDNTILTMAADTRRFRFSPTQAWFRPMAWAATIGLSLAFVLEMSQFDNLTEPTIQAEPSVHSDSDEVPEKRVLGDQALDETIDASRLQQESDMRSDAPAAAKANSPPAAAELVLTEDAVSVSEDFAANDMLLLKDAEEKARARSGPARALAAETKTETMPAPATEAVPAPEAVPMAAFAVKKEQVEHCDAEARLAAASWHACIEELREQNLDAAAALEMDALLSEFPDFRIPDESR